MQATSKKTQDKELPLLPPIARGVGMVVEGVCLLVVLILFFKMLAEQGWEDGLLKFRLMGH